MIFRIFDAVQENKIGRETLLISNHFQCDIGEKNEYDTFMVISEMLCCSFVANYIIVDPGCNNYIRNVAVYTNFSSKNDPPQHKYY